MTETPSSMSVLGTMSLLRGHAFSKDLKPHHWLLSPDSRHALDRELAASFDIPSPVRGPIQVYGLEVLSHDDAYIPVKLVLKDYL